jgi:hypothetical protein
VVSQSQYKREVWLLLHNSDDPELETAALRLYLDESGGADPNTPHAVAGGILVQRKHFIEFENAWDRMLAVRHLKPSLHMKEFGQHGRFGHLSVSERRKLFTEVAKLISVYRVNSISISLSNEEYEAKMPPEVQRVFSVYGMCFLLAAYGTHILAERNSYQDRIPIIMDSGNPYAEHVRASHANIQQIQRENGDFLQIGALAFDDDEYFGILQAADVISWGARRRASNLKLGSGLSPIDRIFSGSHIESGWMPKWLDELGANLKASIEQRKKNEGC